MDKENIISFCKHFGIHVSNRVIDKLYDHLEPLRETPACTCKAEKAVILGCLEEFLPSIKDKNKKPNIKNNDDFETEVLKQVTLHTWDKHLLEGLELAMYWFEIKQSEVLLQALSCDDLHKRGLGDWANKLYVKTQEHEMLQNFAQLNMQQRQLDALIRTLEALKLDPNTFKANQIRNIDSPFRMQKISKKVVFGYCRRFFPDYFEISFSYFKKTVWDRFVQWQKESKK